ncbi:MAG: PTS sugar transporter subunit IIA [Sedimentisphaerales bacterium]|jgi:fructose-specific phosphotransferase system IIA component|nr:PTS sugar transporter subunit IIA [Sedimentisphaerales bacterium]NLZ06244.1 PTS sugar transporter subunit IIA [Phycisphaerae bacterium]HNY79716.1 PTS sugar transporter subunit IIA [Sedimentisphaerales bacterium]HOC64777.1 PTS sugar transporter subunit IIA [Sedimentisphaerales bacterium]HOH65705.1 PTS sugar transporter subunit IIA [Sedimentisphaerales bacterium]
MSLIDLVQEKIVKIPLVSTDKADVLRELVQILKDAGEIEDYDAVLRAICEREEKLSTGLESGIAVPHGKTEAVSTLKLALGIAPQGIDFASIDRKPSQLFFMLVAPPNQSGPHVEALAEIVKLVQSKAFCRAVTAAKDAHEVVELIKGE